MASYQLGPESPRPFAVLSEGHVRRRIDLPQIPEYERYSFGGEYEKCMLEHIHQYLELGTDDRLCYVGEDKGSFVPLLQQKFCLLESVTTIVPGHIHYEESPNHRMLPIKVANVGAEDFFRREAERPPQFDKVILKDAVQFFEEPKQCFENVMKSVTEFGKLLVVHRAAPMNTLPLFTDAKERLIENDQPYVGIIKDLQSMGLDVTWEVQCLPIVMPRLKWIAMMRERFPTQIEMVSNYEVKCGIRELNEGILKYSGDTVEFVDRLLFITAHRPVFNSGYPSLQRFAGKKAVKEPYSVPDDLKYQMEVTSDIQGYLKEKEKKGSQYARKYNR